MRPQCFCPDIWQPRDTSCREADFQGRRNHHLIYWSGRPVDKDPRVLDGLANRQIDTSLPLAHRRRGLSTYYFLCTCPRCTHDLTIYQVCHDFPNLQANEFSLASNIDALRNPPITDKTLITGGTSRHAQMRDAVDELEKQFTLLDTPFGSVKPAELLKEEYSVYKPFIQHGAWAYVDTFLQDCLSYYAHSGRNLEHLCLASLLATRVHPFHNPNPFNPQRLKSTMTVVARLPDVTSDPSYAPRLADLTARTGIAAAQLRELRDVDAVAAGRMMQFMILQHGASGSAHVPEWPFWDEVRAGYEFLRRADLWPDAAARRAVEMWERREPPEVFLPAWRKVVASVEGFAEVGARLISLEFGS
jgi:hypothetical protein